MRITILDSEVQSVVFGDLSRWGSVPPNACCTAELLQQGSISTSEFQKVGGGLQLLPRAGALGAQLCTSTGILAFDSSAIRIAVKIASCSLET